MLHLTLAWGEELITTETMERAKTAAQAVIEHAGTTPCQAKVASDTWLSLEPAERALARGKTGPHVEIARLAAVWISAENAAEAVLEQGLASPLDVSGILHA